MDPSLQPSSLAEGLQGGPRPPPVAIDAIMQRCGWGTHAAPMMEAARGVRPIDGPHRRGLMTVLAEGRDEGEGWGVEHQHDDAVGDAFWS